MSAVSSTDIDCTQCVLCRNNTNESLSKVGDRGLKSILDCSVKRDDASLTQYLQSFPACVLVHNSCRKRYTDVRAVEKRLVDCEEVQVKRLRSSGSLFNWKDMCFLCGEDIENRQNSESGSRRACTLELRKTILQHCADRLVVHIDDQWALDVQARMSSCCDLVAEEAVYHVFCFRRFSGHKSLRSESTTGRPQDSVMVNAFCKLCDWLESSAEGLHTLSELHDKMKAIATSEYSISQLTDESVYSVKHLKRKLIDRYGDHIFFADCCGRKNVVCFRDMCSFIVNDKWYADKSASVEDKSVQIVRTAAKLIAAQIREVEADTESYPTAAEMVSDNTQMIPPLLKNFLSVVISSKLKQNSIGQCIVQAARPHSIIAPLLLGLALDMDLQHGSETLIAELARLGYCASYDETVRYKQSVVMSTKLNAPSEQFPLGHTQWVADNVDHNIRTLDGSGTFHGMGIVSACTLLGDNVRTPEQRIPRLKQRRLTSSELCVGQGIPIVQCWDKVKLGLADICLKPVCQLMEPTVLPAVVNLDLVWHLSLFITESTRPRPNWLGYMQTVCVGDHGKPAVVELLPLIDMNPSDESCVYSTLRFVIDQAKQLNVVPCITFDQPLWLKAHAISRSMHFDIVCRLGGFHLLMSFLGSVGKLMTGSGIEEVLAQIYGRDTVVHVLTGRAYARALRGHFLIESALMSILLRFILPVDDRQHLDTIACVSDSEFVELKDIAAVVLEEKFTASADTVSDSEVLVTVEQLLQQLKCTLSDQSRTAKLWINYIHYISVVKHFLVAERTGNWHLHLKCVGDMLNLFAATGHNNYAKSARLYLQTMIDLPITHPSLYDVFVQHGLHSVRRSDRYWAGVSTDLLIEQTMMRAIKGRGGLTRGRGFTENVRTTWVKTAHQLGQIHLAMSNMTGLTVDSADHVETGESRAARDNQDLQKVLTWFACHNPFVTGDGKLRSLSTGVTAGDVDRVTCDVAEEVGAGIQCNIDNNQFLEVTLKKSDQVRTLLDLQKGTGSGSQRSAVVADNYALFHRLLVLIERCVDVQSYFIYELTPSPAALFKNGFMRKADKPALMRRLISGLQTTTLPKEAQFVLDGGALMHRVRWMKKVTFDDVVKQYLRYVTRCYGSNVQIVFDGYDDAPSTKDHEHFRRLCKSKSAVPNVAVNKSQCVTYDQESFLANDKNKDTLIKLLVNEFKAVGITATQSCGDADVYIASTAVELASTQGNAVAVVADDTDILALLVCHFKTEMQDIYFLPRSKKMSSSQISIRAVHTKLGAACCDQLPVIHAIGGCDTSSALFGIGKATVLNRIISQPSNKSLVAVMQNVHSSREEVIAAGLQLMVVVYVGRQGEDMGSLRYKVFSKLATTSTRRPVPEKLPPTEHAAVFHILRCHQQAVVWKYLQNDILDPLQWGWEMVDGHLQPIMTDEPPAPDDLLNVIRCKCKTDCKSSLCSCRRNGLSCVTACANCHAQLCSNIDKNSVLKTRSDSVVRITTSDSAEDLWWDDDVEWIWEEVVDECDIDAEQVYFMALFFVSVVKED